MIMVYSKVPNAIVGIVPGTSYPPYLGVSIKMGSFCGPYMRDPVVLGPN